ncbi:MAG: universal stress protein [Verrucomicrobia bacterium]|nr:universal stress protein [Verrucomicrobiota bacterium]
MNQLHSIIVGVDFSRCSQKVLTHAVRLAQWNGAQLHLIHVIDELVLIDLAEAVKVPLAEVRAQAARTAAHELEASLLKIGGHATIHVEIGSPIDEILKLVRRGRRRFARGGSERRFRTSLGSWNIGGQMPAQGSDHGALGQHRGRRVVSTIVAGVDFSPTSQVAIKQAHHVASIDGGLTHCLHVYDPPWNRR